MENELLLIFKIFATSPKTWIRGADLQKKLAKRGYHCSVKTIYKHIHTINGLFREVVGADMIISRRSLGWQFVQGYFDEGQLQLLTDAIRYNKDLSYREKTELIGKLLYFSNSTQITHTDLPADKEDKPFSLMVNLSVIMKAIGEEKNIIFQYVNYAIGEDHRPFEVASKHGNRGINYVISPYQIVLDNNHYYLIGYFDARKDSLSMYRVDRMRRVMTYKGMYIDIRDSLDINEFIKSNFNMFVGGKETDLVLHFHKNILRELVSRFGEDMTITPLSGPWYEAVIRHQSYSRGLISWILMLGGQIEVVAPKHIREEIKTEMEKALDRYKK